MRARALAAVVTAVVLAGCSGGSGAGTPVESGSAPVQVGQTTYAAGQRPVLPDLSGPTLSGGRLDVAKLRGHVLVLNAWASWCDPCREESPALAKVAKSFAARGVVFVGIDEQDVSSHAVAFAKQAGTTYQHLVDGDGAMLESLRIVPPAAIPSTLVVDPEGRVAVRFIGKVSGPALTAAVDQVLTGG